MKRFSLFLMIVLLVSAVFISCSAEPANDSGATVAVSISSSKALSATPHVENLPDESTLYWYYTATKDGSGFTTGQTSGLTPIQTDTNGNPVVGLPTVIGYAGASGTGTWFSSGNWLFHFYAFEAAVSPEASTDTAVYTDNTESGVVVPVTPVENSDIGGEASITLKLKDDPREDSKVYIGEYGVESETPTTQNSIYVDFDNAYSGTASDYKLKIYVDGVQVLTSETITGTHDSNNETGRVMFKTGSELATYGDNNLGGLHLIEFKVFKGEEEDPYASGSTGIWARKGYTWYIAGDLVSLESVAQVKISVTNANAFPASQEPTTIEISSEKELRAFAAFVNSGNNCEGLTIKLTKDINLTQPWTPIGNSYRGQENGAYFAGTFDGRKPDDNGNYTISGLTDGENYVPANAKTNGEYSYGLFGIVKNATIKNINLTGVDIKSNNASYTADEVGAVVGYSLGSLKLDNITVSGSVVGDNVGGIIGRAYGTSGNGTIDISNCTNQATVSSSHIHDSHSNSYTDRAAGIAGYINGLGTPVTVENCINSGNITVGSEGKVGTSYIAGICCYGFNKNVVDSYAFTSNKSTGNLTVLGKSGSVEHVAIIVYMCNEAKETGDAYSFSEPTEDYTVGTITVFGNAPTYAVPRNTPQL